MPILELSDAQVVDLVKQLPPERQRAALLALAAGAGQRREERMQYAEAQLRRASSERGLDWDTMSDDQRQEFIDDLLHEDRPRKVAVFDTNILFSAVGWKGKPFLCLELALRRHGRRRELPRIARQVGGKASIEALLHSGADARYSCGSAHVFASRLDHR